LKASDKQPKNIVEAAELALKAAHALEGHFSLTIIPRIVHQTW
jgi:hypothetical protein